MEKQILGQIHGNCSHGNHPCHTTCVSPLPFYLLCVGVCLHSFMLNISVHVIWTQKKVVSVSTDYETTGIVDLLKEYFNFSWSWTVTVIHEQRKWRKKGCGIPFCSKCSQPTITRMHWVELDKVNSSAGMWCSASWAVLCGRAAPFPAGINGGLVTVSLVLQLNSRQKYASEIVQ